MPLTYSQPSQLPEWDPAAPDVVDPGGPKKALGWQANEAPPYGYFNWLFQAIYFWIRYFDDVVDSVLDVEHVVGGATGGKHRKVTYTTARSVRWNLGSSVGGAWRTGGGTEALTAATMKTTPGDLNAVEWNTTFRPWNVGADDTAGSPQYTVTGIGCTYSMVANATTASIELLSINRATGAVVSTTTFNLPNTGGAIARNASAALSIAIDPALFYAIRLSANADAAITDFAWYNVDITAARARLE